MKEGHNFLKLKPSPNPLELDFCVRNSAFTLVPLVTLLTSVKTSPIPMGRIGVAWVWLILGLAHISQSLGVLFFFEIPTSGPQSANGTELSGDEPVSKIKC